MRRHVHIYSLSVLLLSFGGLLIGCGGPPYPAVETTTTDSPEAVDARDFDPLELPDDHQVVPLREPQSGSIIGRQAIVEVGTDERPADSLSRDLARPTVAVDSTNRQAYRVQIFTSRVVGEARREVRVAEEIFDQPVYLDYEVPNYKVRVGSFVDRQTAEKYQQAARGSGYTSAWVVMVNLGIREAAPLYNQMGDAYEPRIDVLDEFFDGDDDQD